MSAEELRLPNKRMAHIRLKEGEVAKYALLPGDPKRVEVAASLLEDAAKIREHRGYLTYNGVYHGIPVTVMCTGMGCPAVAIGVEELAKIGVEVFIRVGSCAAFRREIEIGDTIIATGATRDEGTSRYYAPKGFPAVPDINVLVALIESAKRLNIRHHIGIVRSTDAFYGVRGKEHVKEYMKLGVLATEMELATLFCVAAALGKKAGGVLAVGGNLVTGVNRYKGQQLQKYARGERDMIRVALEAVKMLENKEFGQI